jgi:EAL domain-containing protein (putative c-di-GMP-specific phosphodiesterase class I)
MAAPGARPGAADAVHSILEETGLILDVGSWVLKRASLDRKDWLERGLEAPRVAVNVSLMQLRQRNFVHLVEDAIVHGATRPASTSSSPRAC